MLQIGNTLVSLDLIERSFLCDLPRCKGACCVEGDSGAPLEMKEVAILDRILPAVWDDLSPRAQEVIGRQGVAYIDQAGDTVTSIVDGKNCVFTCRDENDVCGCAIEKAFRAGKIDFHKPVSCHLYPVRISYYNTFTAVNMDRWNICKAAETAGKQAALRAYKFLRAPLIRKFGEDWYEQLDLAAGEWLKQRFKER
jgi:hypothetical protein